MRGKKRQLIAQAAREATTEQMLVDALTPRPKRPWWRRLVDWILRRRPAVTVYEPRRMLKRMKRVYKRLDASKRSVYRQTKT